MGKIRLPDRHLSAEEWAVLWLLESAGSFPLSWIGPKLRRAFPDPPEAALFPAVGDAVEAIWDLGLVRLERPREVGSHLWEEIPEEEVLTILAKYEDMWTQWAAAGWDSTWPPTVGGHGDSVGVYLVLTAAGRFLLDTQVRLRPEVQ